MRILTLFLVVFFLGGCSTIVKESDIVEYDPESNDFHRQNGEPMYTQTKPIVVVAKDKGIKIRVVRDKPVYDEQDKVERQHWKVYAHNDNYTHKCVGVVWRLLDFRYISDHPSMVLIKRKEKKLMGVMVQNVWEIDGVKFAPPPSGYVHMMQVLDPVKKAKKGEECLFIPPEDEIIEK